MLLARDEREEAGGGEVEAAACSRPISAGVMAFLPSFTLEGVEVDDEGLADVSSLAVRLAEDGPARGVLRVLARVEDEDITEVGRLVDASEAALREGVAAVLKARAEEAGFVCSEACSIAGGRAFFALASVGRVRRAEEVEAGDGELAVLAGFGAEEGPVPTLQVLETAGREGVLAGTALLVDEATEEVEALRGVLVLAVEALVKSGFIPFSTNVDLLGETASEVTDFGRARVLARIGDFELVSDCLLGLSEDFLASAVCALAFEGVSTAVVAGSSFVDSSCVGPASAEVSCGFGAVVSIFVVSAVSGAFPSFTSPSLLFPCVFTSVASSCVLEGAMTVF